MPVYSYRCTECDEAFDIRQEFSDAALTACPACQGRLRKVFSAVGVTFNGSGFYRTDSRAGSGGTAGAAKSGGDSSGGSVAGASGSSTAGGSGSGGSGASTSGGSGTAKSASSGSASTH